MNLTGNQKLLAVIAGVLALIVVIFSVLQSGKVNLNVIVVPSDAALTIDGKKAKPGTIHVGKGTHTLKATRQYFDDVTKTINTKNIDPKNPTVYLIAGASSPEAIKWLKDHPEAQAQREAATGAKIDEESQAAVAKYPIINQLPYRTLDYKIDYNVDSKNVIGFYITLTPAADPNDRPNDYKTQLNDYKEEALQFLKANGIDTSKTSITFTPNP